MSEVIDDFDDVLDDDADFQEETSDVGEELQEQKKRKRKHKKNKRISSQQFEERRISRVGKTKNKWRYDPKKIYSEDE